MDADRYADDLAQQTGPDPQVLDAMHASAITFGSYCNRIGTSDIEACAKMACSDPGEQKACTAIKTLAAMADEAGPGNMGKQPMDLRHRKSGRGGAYAMQDLSGRGQSGFGLRDTESSLAPDSSNLTWFNAAATIGNTDFSHDPVHKYALCMKKHQNDGSKCAVLENVEAAHSEFYAGGNRMRPGGYSGGGWEVEKGPSGPTELISSGSDGPYHHR